MDVDPDHGITETQAFKRLDQMRSTYEGPGTRTTFSQFWPLFVTHKRSKNRSKTTLAAIDVAIRVHLEPEFGDRCMADITVDDFEDWMASELKNASPKSVKNWRSVANSIWELAVRKKVVKENVVAQAEAPYVPRREDVDVMTTADIAAVRAAFPESPMGWLLDLVVLVATRCGLRESEIIALRWRDIQWEAGWIHVVQGHVRGETKLPKGKRGRSTPMPEIVKVALSAWRLIAAFGHPHDLVFGRPVDGFELNASSLNKEFKKAVVRSGIRPTEMRAYKQRDGSYKEKPYVELTFHDTRHAWASWCLSSGMPPLAVMQWGGWEDAKTMSIYEHFIPSGFEVDLLNAAIERETDAPLRPRRTPA